MQILDNILSARNITDKELFLNPTIDSLYESQFNPFRLKNMSKVVKQIISSINLDETILIVGDYDVDGVTSTAVLFHFLKFIGAKHLHYKIPLRHEGYALSKSIIDYAKSIDVKLIITVDNGITCIEEVEYAKLLGICVCITDHHEPQNDIPDVLVINPKQPDCKYINKQLSGCGVVYKLLQALACRLSIDYDFVERYLPLVTISTIGDMVSLTGENRLFSKVGYTLFSKSFIKGLNILIEQLNLKSLTFKDIAFSIVSTINAAGRLDDPSIAVNLLLSTDKNTALQLSKELISLNEKRKSLTDEFTQFIINDIDINHSIGSFILYIIPESLSIPEGLVGLITNKIKEHYKKPVILLCSDAFDSNLLKGSARSTSNYNIFEVLTNNSHLFHRFGGHHYACGLTIHRNHIPDFQSLLSSISLTQESNTSFLVYDILPKDITFSFIDDLSLLEPYGKDNEAPYFSLKSVSISSFSNIGKSGQHAKFIVNKDSKSYDSIFFNSSISAINRKKLYDIVFYPSINPWNNKIQLQIASISECI